MKLNKGFYLFAVLGLILVLGTAPLAAGKAKEAVCDDGIDNDGDGKTDCDDPDCRRDDACTGGGETPEPNETFGNWVGINIYEPASQRSCINDYGNYDPDDPRGVYPCTNGEPDMFFSNLSDYFVDQLLPSGKEAVCGALDSPVNLTPNKGYGYKFEGDCKSEGGCAVTVINGFYPFYLEYNGYEIGGMTLNAINPAFHADFEGDDPFVEDQTIDLSEVTITFYKYGNDKKLARCLYADVDLTGTFVFYSDDPDDAEP